MNAVLYSVIVHQNIRLRLLIKDVYVDLIFNFNTRDGFCVLFNLLTNVKFKEMGYVFY